MNGKISLGSMGGLFEKPLHLALNLMTGVSDDDERQDMRRPLMALFKTVLSGDERLTDGDFETVRHLLRDLPPHEISEMIEILRSSRSITADEVVDRLSGVESSEKYNILRAALRLAIRSGRMQENRQYLVGVSDGFGISADDFAAMEEELQSQDLRRRKLLRSGAGVLVALIVLGVFVLTATLLRSVIFGLALAYVLLPVEQYFERKLANPKSLLYRIFTVFSMLGAPLRNLAGRLRRPGAASAAEKNRQVQQQRITRAVSLTGFLLLLLALCGLITVSELSGNYVQRLKAQRDIARMEAAGKTDASAASDQAEITALEKAFAPIGESLENLRSRLDKMPLIQAAIGEVSRMLHDSSAQREVVKLVLQRTGGVVSFTTGLLGALLNVLVDLLLTIFFFLLFLNKIATFCAGNAGAGRQSEYLVRTVFNGNWLPGAREETISEAERIISEIINKLKVWLRGYVTLVLIDGTVYTTVFYFLDVPYFFLLGPLAGCGVLLPYVGPVASAILTLLITLAVGGQAVSTGQIVGIVAAYLIYNGIVEQFILYPMVIGEALGLSTLETIIVVLLGAIFAGIAGMIFALPAAAVLKYLVPQIYHCFDRTADADVRKKEGIL